MLFGRDFFLVLLLFGAAWRSVLSDGFAEDVEAPGSIGAEWAQGNVQLVNDNEFEDFMLKNDKFMAFFFAPWCGHCKNAKPHYKAASLETSVPMIAVDCTGSGAQTCKDYGVSGYPTIKYFERSGGADDGQEVEHEEQDYSGARTEKGFLKFLNMKDPNYVPPPFENKAPESWSDSGRIIHMTDEHFESYRKDHPRFLAFFYAPWCGHCKSAKPSYRDAASRFRPRTFRFLAIDCTEDGQETCKKYDVSSFPTFIYFNEDADPERVFETAERSSGDFITFAWNKLFDIYPVTDTSTPEDLRNVPVKVLREHLRKRSASCKGCSEKPQLIAKVLEVVKKQPKIAAPDKSKRPKKSLMQEKRDAISDEAAAVGWSEETHGNGNVVHAYSEDALEAHIDATKGKGSLVMFFAPWCHVCKDQKPSFVEASTKVKEIFAKRSVETHATPFVAVDCDHALDICQKYSITHYPKYRWITESGDFGSDMPGGRGVEGFTKFVAGQFGEEWTAPPSFEAFVQSQPKVERVKRTVEFGFDEDGELMTREVPNPPDDEEESVDASAIGEGRNEL